MVLLHKETIINDNHEIKSRITSTTIDLHKKEKEKLKAPLRKFGSPNTKGYSEKNLCESERKDNDWDISTFEPM